MRTSKFALFTLPVVGRRDLMDVEYQDSQEVLYCCMGRVPLFDERQYHELFGGNALLIQGGRPYTHQYWEEKVVLV